MNLTDRIQNEIPNGSGRDPAYRGKFTFVKPTKFNIKE
jgi:hypothetical protein